MRRWFVAAIAALLAFGAARAGKVETDFNPNAKFETYKTWDWVPNRGVGHHGVLAGDAARELLERALASQLRGVGLQQVGPGETPDLVVRYWGDLHQGESGTSTGPMGGYDPYTGGYWGDPFQSFARFTEQSATMIVDLIEPATKQLAWRAFINQTYGTAYGTGNELPTALAKAFAKYPPTPSARARKAKEWEKKSAAK